jgi:hypothetical protein
LAPGDDIWHERLEKFVIDIKQDGRLNLAAQRHNLKPILAQ